MEDVSRRTFVQGAAIAASAVTGAAVTATARAEEAVDAQAAVPAEGVQIGGFNIVSGGRRRPEPHTGHPLPQTTGYVGPDAMPIMPVEAPESWDIEADVVVVGTGMGGLTASTVASQAGLRTVIVEKNAEIGGASAHSAINVALVGGSREQILNGYAWPGDTYSIHDIVNKLNNVYQQTINLDLLRSCVIGNAVWLDWMQDTQKPGWVNVKSRFAYPDIAAGTVSTLLGNQPALELLAEHTQEAGGQLFTKTECTALVVADGRVIGIQVKTPEGETAYYKGEKGVILTAGCFGMNQDLLEQYCPTAYMEATQGGPMPWATGECFRMALALGADVSGFDSWDCWDGAADEYWGTGDGNYWHYFWSGERQVAKNPWLLLDKACKRLPYYCGSGVNFKPGEEFQPGFDVMTQSMGDLPNNAAWMSSIGNRNYSIFDDDFRVNLWNFKSAHTGADRARIPVHEGDGTPETPYVSTDWTGEFEKAVERGAVLKADTLEELAEKAGLDVDKFVAAVDEWNEHVATGDDSDFTPQYFPDWLVPVQKPPFYCIPCAGQIGKIIAGLRVNGEMEVLDANANPIPGLYAGFYTAGGICGECCYAGQFGNPSFAGGVAMSGIGGFLAARSAIGSPVTYDDLSDEAKAANEAAMQANSERYMNEAADGSYMKNETTPDIAIIDTTPYENWGETHEESQNPEGLKRIQL